MASIQAKIGITIALVIGVAIAVGGIVGNQSMNRQVNALYLEKSEALVQMIDANIRSGDMSSDRGELFNSIQKHLWLEPSIEHIQVSAPTNNSQLLVVFSSDGRFVGDSSNEQQFLAFKDGAIRSEFIYKYGIKRLRIHSPLHEGRQKIGSLQVDFSMDTVDEAIQGSKIAIWSTFILIGGVTLLTLIWLLNLLVSAPLQLFVEGTKKVADGDLNHRVSLNRNDEFGSLAQSFNSMTNALDEALNTAKEMAFIDELTGLPNRRSFISQLDALLKDAVSDSKGSGVLLYVDLDEFKKVNDTYGHDAGDQLLIQISEQLLDLVGPEDMVARIGGDEFLVLLNGFEIEQGRNLECKVKDFQPSLSKLYRIGGHSLRVRVSVGAFEFGSGERDVDYLMKQADMSMYRSKQGGRTQISSMERSESSSSTRKKQLEFELMDAIADKQFLMHYQPQFDIDNKIIGMEALARWQHPEYGLVYPADFISLAERPEYVEPLSSCLASQACNDFSELFSEGLIEKGFRVSLNTSPLQLALPNFVESVMSLLKDNNLEPEYLELEITEHSLFKNTVEAKAIMEQLRAKGVSFSLDDFGTGYSSLAYLKSLPFQRLKIDQSFVSDIATNEDDLAIVDSIIGLAKHYNMTVVAEGVSAMAQFEILREHGCDQFQGYMLGRPIPLDEIASLFRSRLNEC